MCKEGIGYAKELWDWKNGQDGIVINEGCNI